MLLRISKKKQASNKCLMHQQTILTRKDYPPYLMRRTKLNPSDSEKFLLI